MTTNLLSGAWHVRYGLAVILPTVIVLLYLTFVAEEGYIARGQVMVEHEAQVQVPDIAAGMLSLGGGTNKADALIVKTFMESAAMLEKLDADLGIREHFSDPSLDPWFRLSRDASREDFLEYYRSRISVEVDDESTVINLEFVAHNPEFAANVVRRLIEASEEFVNEVSHYLAREQIAFIEKEVARTHEDLREASRNLVALQREYEVLSPDQEVQAAGMVLGGLIERLAEERTTLKALESYMSPGASEVVSVKQRVNALESQVEEERAKMVGKGQEGLNDVVLAYRDAEIDLNLSKEIYQSAIGTLETKRLEAARKAKYLVAISGPILPDSAEHPRILYWSGTVFVLLNIAFFVLGLIVATINDHRE